MNRRGRTASLWKMSLSLACRRIMDALDVAGVFHVSLHERAAGPDVVLVELLFVQGFLEMLTDAVLGFFGKQL